MNVDPPSTDALSFWWGLGVESVNTQVHEGFTQIKAYSSIHLFQTITTRKAKLRCARKLNRCDTDLDTYLRIFSSRI